MSAHLPDAGNASIIGSGATAATVTGGTMMGLINEYAVVLGLILSLISLILGVVFKISAEKKREVLQAEELKRREEEMRMNRQRIDALSAMVETVMRRGNPNEGRRDEERRR